MDNKNLTKKKISFHVDIDLRSETKKPEKNVEISEIISSPDASLKSSPLQTYVRGSSLEPSNVKNKRLNFRLFLPENLRALNCSPSSKTVISDSSSVESKICNSETSNPALKKSYDRKYQH